MASALRQLSVQAQLGQLFVRSSFLQIRDPKIFSVPVRGAAIAKKGGGAAGKAGGGAKAKKILDVETVR